MKPLAECLPPEQARVFVELVRSLGKQVDRDSVEVRDEAGAVLAFVVLPSVQAPPPDAQESPEFLEELARRLNSPEPALPVEDVLDFLDHYPEHA